MVPRPPVRREPELAPARVPARADGRGLGARPVGDRPAGAEMSPSGPRRQAQHLRHQAHRFRLERHGDVRYFFIDIFGDIEIVWTSSEWSSDLVFLIRES